ncbi:MAG: hypothetical protein F8N37_04855 [Telmatospirillum sp.]|nr:hypothetical protein [Telmatospirillum sp.]
MTGTGDKAALSLPAVVAALEREGLRLCGGFTPDDADDVPIVARGRRARSLLLVGNAGPAMWRRFQAAMPAGPDPLDHWTRAVVTEIARRYDATPVFVFDTPPRPFQRWAVKAGGCHFSPLGLLIHPRFGLWHALRAALLFDRDLGVRPSPTSPSPCEDCRDKPCLATCPAHAFRVGGYDVPACVRHLETTGGEDCMSGGCRARRACPVGAEHLYGPAQAAFHMQAFRTAISAFSRTPAQTTRNVFPDNDS